MSEVGRGVYLANLEKARKALLDRAGAQFKTESAQEQLEDAKQGLMRPRARPEVEVEGPSEGLGLGLMRAMSASSGAKETSASEQAPEKSIRPKGKGDYFEGGGTAVEGKALFDGLVARGLEPHVAEGFIMNFKDESGLNPGINEANPLVKGSRGGFGLYQLTGPRRREYEAFANSRGVNYSDVDAQLDFLVMELDGSEKSAGAKIRNTSTAGEAGVAIVNHFLRPAKSHRSSRAAKYSRFSY
jgi:hypothetical protein